MRNQKVLAVLPARGGSKRIPKKNIKNFCGKPLIGWPLSVLKDGNIADEIIVSTDSEEIAKVAQELGATVPFMRPSELADDFTGTSAVVKHAVEWYLENIGPIEYVLTVYPAAVFLTQKDLENAFNILKSSNCQTVFAVSKYSFPIQRAIYLDEQQNISMFQPEHYSTRSQDLVEAYHDAGQFCFSKLSAVLNNISTFSNASRMIVLPRYRAVDIDTFEDFELAQKLFMNTSKKDDPKEP